ncbi:low-density lipoprotein receptor-related protein 6-like [Argopecten irradians]|uniref:low-density lipoprotein receptor-related protein 6-like n=1 Tax=Argopecten irradians TaxID=31199 RepID=UPI00372149F3
MDRTAAFVLWIACFWSRLNISLETDPCIIVSVKYNAESGVYIYNGDSTTVTTTSPSNFTRIGLPGLMITSMDVNVADGSIYFYDYTSQCIYRFHQGSTNSIHCGISRSYFTSIAYDWVSGNIYWTDSFFNWIAVQPVHTTDSSMYKVIVQDDVEKPSALAVDAVARYVFWFDISPSGYRIERSLLDGTLRVPIITTSLISVEDIEIDAVENRIYWVDYSRYTIESSQYDGTDRKIIYRGMGLRFQSIAVDTNHVCVTVYSKNSWHCYYKSTPRLKFWRTSTSPDVITMFKDQLKPTVTDMCSTLGCGHFCVNLQPDGKCMCKEGYKLDKDGKNCTENHPLYSKGIVVSNATNICMLNFRTITGHIEPLRCVENTVQGCQFLAVDTSNKVIYYVDTTSNFISEYILATDTTRQIAAVDVVSGLVYDWIDGNLYWSESVTGRVKYVTIATLAATDLVQGIMSPSNLTMDPYSRTLFWIEGTRGDEIRIVSFSLTTNETKTLMVQETDTILRYFKDIFFDVASDRLYLLQHYTSTLYSLQKDGNSTYFVYNIHQPVDRLIIYKRYAIWSSTSAFNSLSLETKSNRNMDQTNSMGAITGLAVYDESVQIPSKGPCSQLNGGCEQLCMTGSNGSALCACSYGLTLHVDGRSCISVPQSSNFILLSDFNNGRLFQISTMDTHITGLDIVSVEIPNDAVYDPKTSFLFWTERNDGKIEKARLNGSNFETIYTPSGYDSYATVLSMDHSTGNLYYTVTAGYNPSTSPGSVGVLKPSTGLTKTIVNDLDVVYGLALYPSKGVLFYTHHYPSKGILNIVQTSMDGATSTVFVEPSGFLTSLVIDYSADRLYWSSLTAGIEWKSISGSKRGSIYTPFTRIRSIDIGGDFLYVTSERIHKVVKMNLHDKTEASFMADNADFSILINLHVYPGQVQPVHPVCANNNGECSTFCLPSPSTSSSYCACQDGTDIKIDDPYTCQGVTRCALSIPNGSFRDPCSRNSGDVCTFECNTGYASTVASHTLTCGSDGQWDGYIQLLCQRKASCHSVIPNGQFDNTCTYYSGESCVFRCDVQFASNVTSQTLTCGQNGQWNENLQLLCQLKASCPSVILNGQFDNPCTYYSGESCTYRCDSQFISTVGSQKLTCRQDGQWNGNLQLLCQRRISCPSAISDGKFDNTCSYFSGESCTFRCNSQSTSTVITCGQDGQWSKNLQLICQPESNTAANSVDNEVDVTKMAVYIGSGLVALAMILTTCVLILRRCRSTRPSVTRSEPNVYYTPHQPAPPPPGAVASGVVNPCMYNIESPEKMAGLPTMAAPTPPYSARPDSTYDTIPAIQNIYEDPAPPYEELSPIQRGPSATSEASMISAQLQGQDSDYLTLLRIQK